MALAINSDGKEKKKPEVAVKHTVEVTVEMIVRELEREVEMRERFYTQWIYRNVLRKEDAIRQLASMKAALQMARIVAEHEKKFKLLSDPRTVEVIV